MAQENSASDQNMILILGTVKSEKKDFVGRLNSFSLLRIIDKHEKTLLNIPAWPVLIALIVFVMVRTVCMFYRRPD